MIESATAIALIPDVTPAFSAASIGSPRAKAEEVTFSAMAPTVTGMEIPPTRAIPIAKPVERGDELYSLFIVESVVG